MRCPCFGLALAAGLALLSGAARADVLIQVDKAAQQMTVTVDGVERYTWKVSTGIADYDTPEGDFKPFRMERDHFSQEWDDAPMPYSIFFTQEGHAIHGTNLVRHLGRPASHGCVRLSVANAATLFALVKDEGMKNTRVELSGDIPEGNAVARTDPPLTYSDDTTGSLPPRHKRARNVSGWQETQDGPRYYYRERPYVPARRYGYGGVAYPYGW